MDRPGRRAKGADVGPVCRLSHGDGGEDMGHRLAGADAEKFGEVAERGRLARNRMMAPCFRVTGTGVEFSASPPALRVIVVLERFGAGIAWPAGVLPRLAPDRLAI